MKTFLKCLTAMICAICAGWSYGWLLCRLTGIH